MDLLTALAAAISLLVPGRSSATPSVAADGEFVVVAWSASDSSGATDVYAATSRDGARSFASPVRVNSTPGSVRANGEQPPQLVLSRRTNAAPLVTIVWAAKGQRGTTLAWARSDDGGRSFQPSTTVADTNAPGNRGWHHAAADASGRVFVAWLDHRELAAEENMMAAHHEHAAARPDGVAMAQKSKLYVQALDRKTAAHAVTGGVCYCCKTALAISDRGVMHAAWRHVYRGNFRDIAYARSADGGATFTSPLRISEDHWMLDGCPDDGPAIAVDDRDQAHVVWPTLVAGDNDEPTIALFYATTSDGRAFSSRLRLPAEGTAHHPQIAVEADGSILAAWDESAGGVRRVVLARAATRSTGSDGLRFSRSILSSDDAAVYPALAIAGRGAVVAWTSKRGAESRIAVARQEF